MKKLVLICIIMFFVCCNKQDEVVNNNIYYDEEDFNFSMGGDGIWNNTNLTYSFGTSFPSEYKDAVRNAIKTWDNASLKINFDEISGLADIVIEMGNSNHIGCPILFEDDILAHGFYPPPIESLGNFAGDLHFYNKWAWSINGSTNYDIETSALHEIGHILGLGHSSDSKLSVMYRRYMGIKRTLSPDDIKGLRQLYSESNSITIPTITTIEPVTINSNQFSSGGVIVTDGGNPIIQKGICWGTNSNPTLLNKFTTEGVGSQQFSSTIANLSENTTYYVRAYATNSIGTGYGNQFSITTNSNSTLKIGDSFGGGIVYYIDATGKHGLILAPNDQDNGRGASWGCNSIEIAGADSKNYLSGYQNTNDILNFCSESGIAASLCFNLSLNGYNDWVLPSEIELSLMHDIYKKGIGYLSDEAYWSSTESNSNKAVAFWMGENETLIKNKTYTYKVRAIRYF
jgi:hypothetical protein